MKGGDTMLYRGDLQANTEVVQEVNSHDITILNVGPGNLYVAFDETATLDSLLIPPNMGRSFKFLSKLIGSVHVIADEETLVQIDDMR